MASNKELFIQLLQFFQPANPFYTNILLEKKRFTLEEINNRLLPYFFYSSFFGLFFCYFSVKYFKYFNIIFTITGLQILAIFLVILSKPRNICLLQLSYSICGIYSIYNSALRLFLINDKKQRINSSIGKLKIMKYLITAFSAWIGQGIYNQSHSYNLIITLTLLPLIYSEFYIFFIMKITDYKNIIILNECSKKMFTKELIIALTCSSTSIILQIYLTMFSQVMLHSKINDIKIFNEKFFKLIDIPLIYISNGLIFLFSKISSIYKPNNTNISKIKIKSGYIEGTIKIMSSITSLFLIYIFDNKITDIYMIWFLSIGMLSFFLLNIVKSIKPSYYLYFNTLVFLITVDTIAKKYIHKSQNKLFSTILTMILETLIHSLINMYCRFNNLSFKFKSNIYLSYSLFALLFVIIIKFYY